VERLSDPHRRYHVVRISYARQVPDILAEFHLFPVKVVVLENHDSGAAEYPDRRNSVIESVRHFVETFIVAHTKEVSTKVGVFEETGSASGESISVSVPVSVPVVLRESCECQTH
jgi:hypothetical protein